MLKRYCIAVSLTVALLTPFASLAKESWHTWLQGVKSEAVAQGIRLEVVNRVLSRLKQPSRRVLKLDRTQPEKRITFKQYRHTRAGAYRIRLGQKMQKKYHPILESISDKYGVSPCFILSFWGLETSYGRFMGRFPVVQSLATLAYDSRRSAFFRKQLFYALRMIDEGHVTYDNLKGEWAGASGHPQFLPSSWHYYAVDHNLDGRRDIWTTRSDAFASIANYLIGHGWRPGEPWAREVVLPHHFDHHLIENKTKQAVRQWRELGVHLSRPSSWPDDSMVARIVYPDGGPALLAFNNFDVIMRWNRSTYYAGTVGYMAEKICKQEL